jgi:hypothetical protein
MLDLAQPARQWVPAGENLLASTSPRAFNKLQSAEALIADRNRTTSADHTR